MFGLCISTVILNSKNSSQHFASFVFMDNGVNQVLLHVFCIIICIPFCSCNVQRYLDNSHGASEVLWLDNAFKINCSLH
jgi:hypothetical protein